MAGELLVMTYIHDSHKSGEAVPKYIADVDGNSRRSSVKYKIIEVYDSACSKI